MSGLLIFEIQAIFKNELNLYFKAENLVLRARSESVGFAEIVNKDRMVGTKAFMPFRVQRHRVKTKRLSLIIS